MNSWPTRWASVMPARTLCAHDGRAVGSGVRAGPIVAGFDVERAV